VESYKTVYAGSNQANDIRSIHNDRRIMPKEYLLTVFLQQDLYMSILHDPYRNVYYRFMFQGISGPTVQTDVNEKPVAVIVMDEQFNYLSETVLGLWGKWNWYNSFVTAEGLMIEYFDPDLDSEEEYLTFKILTIEKL